MKTPRARMINAKRAGNQAIERAAEIIARSDTSRSTRTRAAYKAKADGLDRVLRILAGKE